MVAVGLVSEEDIEQQAESQLSEARIMAGIRKAPDLTVLQGHVREGMTVAQIAERYGMTGEGVRRAFIRAGEEPPNAGSRTRHNEYLPWDRIRADHASDLLARRLRSYSKRQQGKRLDATENRLLDEWLAYMDGGNHWGVPLAVHYSRHDPEGFWLEPRKPGDRQYVSPPEG